MLSRTLAMPTLLAASVAVPYVASNAPGWIEQVRRPAASTTPVAAAATGPAALAATSPSTPLAVSPPWLAPQTAASAASSPAAIPVIGQGVSPTGAAWSETYPFSEVLSFNVTKDWVYQRWDRKSTALADLDLFGVRVPLVTGTQVHDLAGSLTYFFGADGRVKRISFRGRTGDTTQLAMLLHQRFGLQAQPTAIAGEQLLQARRGNEVISELRTRTAPILWSNSPHESFTVELELQDPVTAKPLSALGAFDAAPAAATPASPTAVTPPAAQQAAASSPQAPTAAKAETNEPPPPREPAWKTFFPRSRISEGQVDQLNRSNLYQ